MTRTMPCIFCQIIARQAPAEIVHEDEEILVFKDLHPRAPMHVLLVPKIHVATINDIAAEHVSLLGKLFLTAKHLAAQWAIAEHGYRLTVNVGRGGGQVIDHIHMHMVSGWQR
jgi:histidine triad (HIT) family protein